MMGPKRLHLSLPPALYNKEQPCRQGKKSLAMLSLQESGIRWCVEVCNRVAGFPDKSEQGSHFEEPQDGQM